MKSIIYNRPTSFEEVLTDSKLHNVLFKKFSISDNMKKVYRNGCKTDDKILPHCKELSKQSNSYLKHRTRSNIQNQLFFVLFIYHTNTEK